MRSDLPSSYKDLPRPVTPLSPDMLVNPNSLSQYAPSRPLSGIFLFIVFGGLLLIILSWIFQPVLDMAESRVYCILHDCDPAGPAVPWADQIAVADQAALKVDKDALLESVTAWPAARDKATWTYTKTLEVTLGYVRPNGSSVDVIFLDTDPSSTIKVLSYDSGMSDFGLYEPVQKIFQRNREALQAARVSPREVIQQTWAEADAHAQSLGLRIYPIVGLDPGDYSHWNVTYWPLSGLATPVPSLTQQFVLNYSSSFKVNSQTGIILDRENQFLQPTVTPAIP
jgi:hypothetical protein